MRSPRETRQLNGIPPGLAAYIPRPDHDELSKLVARWRKRGLSLDGIEAQLRQTADIEATLRLRLPDWQAEASQLRRLRARLVTVLRQTLAVYDRDPERARVLRFPIPEHARAILEHLDAFRRANRGERKSDDPRIDRADPFSEPFPLSRGPAAAAFTKGNRVELAQLGLSRREITWLLVRATPPSR